ncbi:hypothetical protein [Rhizosphaericola mali]|uniref:Uncharacterized protein n=1 Tax=Rhizosphaericola mali TaxID=2545455 RepID=A0A5P2FYV1_9BACT|nr:hypothetical protein [Rhizosphaericola mali]QES88107.1 hypothetical protein E0W69_005315 [Rhizosphaericola mali]
MRLNQYKIVVLICLFISCKYEKIIQKWPDDLPYSISERDKVGKERKFAKHLIPEYIQFPVAKGTIYLKKMITLNGLIWIQPNYYRLGRGSSHPKVQIVFKDWNDITPDNIRQYLVIKQPKEVDSVTMAIPLPDSLGDSTCFVKDSATNSFWRLLISKGNIKIYDNSAYGIGYFSSSIIRINFDGDSTILIKSVFNKQNLKKKIEEFITKRYNEKIDMHFNTITDILFYIIKRENT